MNILIGGDISPVGVNESLFKNGKIHQIFNELLYEFNDSDLNIINLECPLIKTINPISKSGPVMGVQDSCINGLINAGIDIIGIANNHILDHDEEGVLNTIKTINGANAKCVGAGANLEEAQQIQIHEIDRVKIGVVAMAEQEFSIATKKSAGANPIDIINFTRQMKEHRANLDFVIVLLHAGYQHYPYPTPELQKASKFLVEQGADAVICQHSHCAGCLEEYMDSLIVYGQGNFIFNKPNKEKSWYEGFLIKLALNSKVKIEYDLIPFEQTPDVGGARKMNENRANDFLEEIYIRSNQIIDEEFVEKRWAEYTNQFKNYYTSILRGHNKLIRKINKITSFTDVIYSEKDKLTLQNIVRCESHREALKSILENN